MATPFLPNGHGHGCVLPSMISNFDAWYSRLLEAPDICFAGFVRGKVACVSVCFSLALCALCVAFGSSRRVRVQGHVRKVMPSYAL